MIEELEKLLKEATPGPWRPKFYLIPPEDENKDFALIDPHLIRSYDGDFFKEDAKLICLLRNNAEKLLAVVKAARELEQKYKEMQSHIDSPPRRFEALFIALKDLDTSSQAPKSEDPR